MRIALISDIHANLPALLALEDVLAEADQVICLGDLVGYYCHVNEVLDYVRDLNPTCVLGNHDYFLLKGCPSSAPEAVKFGITWADRVISKPHREWLSNLPTVWGGFVNGRSLLAVHGSPWQPITDYLYDDSPKLRSLQDFNFDLVAFGQTHRPMLNTTAKTSFINPGSVGQSRHAPALASMAVWEPETMKLELVDRPYDSAPVIGLALQNGAGDWAAKHLTS